MTNEEKAAIRTEAIQYAADGIWGAFTFGGLNKLQPEKGHWLERWWNRGREHQQLIEVAASVLAEMDFRADPAEREKRAEIFALLQRARGE